MKVSRLTEIEGKTPTSVEVLYDAEVLVMHFTDGSQIEFSHEQSCCESCAIEEVAGEWRHLIGHPLLVAEERVANDHHGDLPPEGCEGFGDSNTWTFYTFRSVGGTVDVRWHGTSNGCYSERVDWLVTAPDPDAPA